MLHEPPDRKYWNVSRSDTSSAASDALVTLISYDEDGNIEILGTAFVIYGNHNNAICVGASHSFEAPKRRSLLRHSRRELSHLPDLEIGTHHEFKADKIFGMVVRNGQPFVCKIASHCSREGYDVLVFTIIEPTGNDVFNWRFQLDFKVPSIGDEVAAFVNKAKLEPLEPGMAKSSMDFHIRHGFVTDVSWEPDQGGLLKGQSFIVRTTIPMEGGMSGSPMIWFDKEGDSCAAWGVVSSDRSNDESKKKFTVAGDSAASMLWPAMGLSLEVSMEAASAGQYTLLGEILKMGIFDDRSEKVNVHTCGNPEKIEVHYCNSQSQPVQSCMLTTRGHKFIR